MMPKGAVIPRISKACDQCSRYRRKCDGNTPCLLCIQKKRVCSYEKIAKKRGPEPKLRLGINSHNISANTYPTPHSYEPQTPFEYRNANSDPEPLRIPTPTLTPAARWTRVDFLSTVVIDAQGSSGTILDMYYAFAYQHVPMFSKQWLNNNINDVPMHVLHVIYMLVLLNAKQAVPNGWQIAKDHTDYVKSQVIKGVEEMDPFMVCTLLNLAMCGLYVKEPNQSILYLAMAIRGAQMLGMDKDADLYWISSASGRVLGGEVGLDKQFVRSLWFLLYMFDHHNILVFQNPMMIETVIPPSMITSYIAPNEGDSSNIPLNFLTHSQFSLPLLSIGKEIFLVTTHHGRMELLLRLDKHYHSFPFSHHPGWAVQRSINEVYLFSKFCLLVPLYLDLDFIPFDKGYVPKQLELSIWSVLDLAKGFIDYSENTVGTDPTFLFLSKTLYVAALGLCLMRNARSDLLNVFQEAIRLKGFPQDYGVFKAGRVKSSKVLVDLLSFE